MRGFERRRDGKLSPRPCRSFEQISHFIKNQTPSIAAGLFIGGCVTWFFKYAGDISNEKTNQEIARWIRTRSFETGLVADEAVSWPETFSELSESR